MKSDFKLLFKCQLQCFHVRLAKNCTDDGYIDKSIYDFKLK